MENVKGKKIFVGLSGGVDSAVSAALLTQAGAKVTGVFIKGWYPPGLPCTWASDRRDAMRVAAHLGIPFHTLDAAREYKTSVIDYLVREYAAGRTPNPDVFCNRDVKFGAFARFAKPHDARIATGHYMSGEKDQRYFLWAVPQAVFQDAAFPVAHMRKEAVRALARRFRLPVAEKHDSQGVCFLGPVSVDEFLRSEFSAEPGAAVDISGARVGTHAGAVFETLGERVRLSDAAPGPWYVLAKNMQENTLTVGHSAQSPQSSHELHLSHANWFAEPVGTVTMQYRYRGPRIPGTFAEDTFRPLEAITEPVAPGQSLVFYDGADRMLGGGVLN